MPMAVRLCCVMTEKAQESAAAAVTAVLAARDRLRAWFLDHALPVWDAVGVDRHAGGYFETVGCANFGASFEAAGPLRRGRVVARQIYVFDVGHRLGWRSAHTDPIAHGCEFLFSHLYAGAGCFHTAVDLDTRLPLPEFSLYEQAFYLFALARLHAARVQSARVQPAALACLDRLRRDFGRADGGFEESHPASLPLKSNPHMHLLEAALEWIDTLTEADSAAPASVAPWVELARELVGLCLTRFRAASTGAIREYFDSSWEPVPGDAGRIVEPGHQFEWAWLLLRWARSAYSTVAERMECAAAAEQLVTIGETWGVDRARGIAINEIWDDLTPKDTSAKLWPQTERLKAWCALLEHADDAARFAHACNGIVTAAQGLSRYLRSDVKGLWHEQCSPAGEFPPATSKASSMYHVVCAIDVLCKTSSSSLTSVLYSQRENRREGISGEHNS